MNSAATADSVGTRLLKVVVLGNANVGKSALMNRFVCNKFESQSYHTIGVEFLNKEVHVDGHRYTMQIWDTAGQERFKSLRRPFYRGSDVCMLTFALDDASSFDSLRAWHQEYAQFATEADHFPLVIVGNKCDVAERAVTAAEAQRWCLEHGGAPYIETSAKESTNVAEAFAMAARCYCQMEEAANHNGFALSQPPNQIIDLNKARIRKAGCC